MLITVFILFLFGLSGSLFEFFLLSGLIDLERIELNLGLDGFLGLLVLLLLLDGSQFQGVHLLLVLFGKPPREAQLLILLLAFLLFFLYFLIAIFLSGLIFLPLEGLKAGLGGIRLIGLLLYDFQLRFQVLKSRVLILLSDVLLELIALLVDGTHSRRKSFREFGRV